jgi:hypothetical protein
MYRSSPAQVIITKPTGEVVARPILLFYDYSNDTVEIRIQGAHLYRGMCFGLRLKDITTVLQEGECSETLPPLPPPEET